MINSLTFIYSKPGHFVLPPPRQTKSWAGTGISETWKVGEEGDFFFFFF